ncbi:hypothetical protein CDL60_28085 [Roseateles noduli]|nr:hypothetical protein CDL60_28085 [Roseateles noduli]
MLLERQQAMPDVPSRRVAAFVEALHERFPPDSEGFGDYDGFVDEHTGPTTNFGLFTRGHHFEAAYQHAVVQARRLGLNLYDPQSGEHHLADGRRLPEGEAPFDSFSADVAWHGSDWKAAVAALREAAGKGDRCALHDLGRCFFEGHGVPRQVMLAGVLMQLAAASDSVRRRQRLETLKAWPADLRVRQSALRERLAAAAALLPEIDAEVESSRTRRQNAPIRWVPATLSEYDWWWLREVAEDGDRNAAYCLAYCLGPSAQAGGRPPWPSTPNGFQRYLLLGAERRDHLSMRRVAAGFLSGELGWPLDVPQGLLWMRRALAFGTGTDLQAPIERLARRMADGWDPAKNRAQAEQAMHEAMRTLGPSRLALFRTACELDLPDAWRRLGTAYQRGDLGLPKETIVGAALHLHAQKELTQSASELSSERPAALGDLGDMSYDEVEDALRLCHQLIGDPAPWETIERFQHLLDNSTVMQISSAVGQRTRVEELDGRRRPRPAKVEVGRMAEDFRTAGGAMVSSESRESRESRDSRDSRESSESSRLSRSSESLEPPRDHRWHVGHLMLVLGAAGPLVLIAAGVHGAGFRRGLILSALLAIAGAWRCGRQFEWSVGKRLLVGIVAAVPGVGLLPAASVLLAQMRRVGEAGDSGSTL